ncbi:MAG: chromosomal replication initiator protein DnaA [Chloroflexi bacterium]|nr:chromosomal replication initiator protein DnaA [Chloroflexota bacterium]
MTSITPLRPAREVWETTLGQLELQVTRSVYDTWLKSTTGIGFEDDRFVVGVPNSFVAESLETRFQSLVRKTLLGVVGQDLGVEFRVTQGANGHSPRPGAANGHPDDRSGARRNGSSLVWLNNRYTFDTFIMGSSNRMAYAAALAVAENPGKSYNPLFIYGGAGLGKTHLLHAIGHTAVQRGARVICVSAEQFTNEFITGIRERSTDAFCQKYRNVDVLLIDDVQFIAGKEQTEEGFFHTFNDLHNANHQIVLTSDRPPAALTLLENRLRSRFEWGLITDIQPPELETRIAILQAKARALVVEVSQDTLQFIARRYQRNIRELEGALNRVVAFSRLTRAPIDSDLAAKALEDIGASRSGRTTTPALVVEHVCSHFEMPAAALTSKRRDAKTALARQVAMYLIRDELHLPFAEIGSCFGGRDHSTVVHACEKIEEEVNINPQLRRRVLDIRAQLHPDDTTKT